MTKAAKAKTKSLRVWLASFPHWERPDVYFDRKSVTNAQRALGKGLRIISATLTWTPPKKRAKR